MSKVSRVREVLEKYFSWTTYGDGQQVVMSNQIDMALVDLAEIVRGKRSNLYWTTQNEFIEKHAYNQAIDRIAKLFTDKEV